jgi:hypothetical protein
MTRGIFVLLTLYGVLALIWSALRMPETLPLSEQKSLAVREVLGAFRQTVTNRQTIRYALAAGGVQASLYGFVFSSEQVFTEIYALGNSSVRLPDADVSFFWAAVTQLDPESRALPVSGKRSRTAAIPRWPTMCRFLGRNHSRPSINCHVLIVSCSNCSASKNAN